MPIVNNQVTFGLPGFVKNIILVIKVISCLLNIKLKSVSF